jgi:hypothetical protein
MSHFLEQSEHPRTHFPHTGRLPKALDRTLEDKLLVPILFLYES